MTSESMRRRRLPAEWEAQQAVVLSLPDAEMDWSYMLGEVEKCYFDMASAIVAGDEEVVLLTQNVEHARDLMQELPQQYLHYVRMALNDTWVRDYGPLTVSELSLTTGKRRLAALDCGFNGWGLKFAADCDNLVTLRMHEAGHLCGLHYHNCRDFILEGGSIESDGKGTIMTTSRCLCSPNRNGGIDKQLATQRLAALFGADHILWLDHGALAGDDTDSHIDTLARLCPNDTILYTCCTNRNDQHYDELLKMKRQLDMFRTAEGNPFNLIELPLPDPIFDPDDGHRLPATYCNYLVTNSRVLVPSYGQDANDELARKLLSVTFPSREAVSVNCLALIRQHGSLHCSTMQIPSPEVLR